MKGVRKLVEITLEDAYAGKMTYLDFTRKRCCEACDGKGGSNVKKCPDCKGRGIVTKMVKIFLIKQKINYYILVINLY